MPSRRRSRPGGTAVAASENSPPPGRSKFTSRTRRTRTRCGRSLAISPAMRCAIAWCLPPSRRATGWPKASKGWRRLRPGRFVIHGGHDRHRIAPNRIGVEIEAALAFGTGHHGTTLGCLMALDRVLNDGARAAFSMSAAGPACSPSRQRGRPGGQCWPATLIPSAFGWRGPMRALTASTRSSRSFGRTAFPTAACRRPGRLIWCFANILLGPLKQLAQSDPASRSAGRPRRDIRAIVRPGQCGARGQSGPRLVLERRISLDGWVTLVLVRPARRIGGRRRRHCRA